MMFIFNAFILIIFPIIHTINAIPPKLDEFQSSRTLKNGTKFKIFCVILEGTKPFQFEWRFNDHQLSKLFIASEYKIDSFNDDQSQLTIAKLDRKHSGTYSCSVRNNFGSDRQSTRLTVTGLSHQQFLLAINMWRIISYLKFRKFISFSLTFVYSFMFHSDEIKMLPNMLICYIFVFFSIFISVISKSPPKLVELVPRRSQNVGTKLNLFCSVHEGHSPFQFEWFKNDQPILVDSYVHKYQIDTSEDNSLLTIVNLNDQDSANYSCMVRNDFGFDSQTTILIVKGLFFYNDFLFQNNMWRLICIIHL